MNPEIEGSHRRVGKGPPLVLLHNGFDSGLTWDRVASFLEKDHTCHIWDRDGYGVRASAGPATPKASLEDGVRELEEIMADLPRNPVPLLGHCMGGAIALLYAHRHPHRVSHLVLEAVGFYLHPFTKQVIDLMKMKWADLSPQAQQKMTRMHGFEAAPQTWAHIIAHTESYLMSETYDIRGLLPEVQTPVLLIQGTKDNLLPQGHSDEIRPLFPNAQYWEAVDRGHDVHNGDPELYAQRLGLFLQGQRI